MCMEDMNRIKDLIMYYEHKARDQLHNTKELIKYGEYEKADASRERYDVYESIHSQLQLLLQYYEHQNDASPESCHLEFDAAPGVYLVTVKSPGSFEYKIIPQ